VGDKTCFGEQRRGKGRGEEWGRGGGARGGEGGSNVLKRRGKSISEGGGQERYGLQREPKTGDSQAVL